MSTTEPATSDVTLNTQSVPEINPDWKYLMDLGRSLNLYGTPFITALGLFGNICTFLIMSRPGFNKSSTSIYFRWLAIVDFDVLLFSQIYIWVDDNLGPYYHFWQRNDILCKLNYVNFGWSLTSSASLLVAVTFERFLITAMPLKSKIYCTRRNAKIACAAITAFLGAMWFISLFQLDPKWGPCQLKNMKFMAVYGRWMFSAVYTFIATPTIFILNSFLVYKLMRARRARKLMTGVTSQDAASYAQYQRLTMMAVTVSVTYLVLTLPTTAVNTIGNWTDKSVITSLTAWISLFHSVGLMIRNFNHAINFVLYLLINNRIRAEFISMMTCNKRDPANKIRDVRNVINSSFTSTLTSKASVDKSIKY